MKKILIIILCLSTFSVFSQNIEANLKSFYGIANNKSIEYFYGGGEIELLYAHPIKKGFLRTGIEFRTIDWGNHLSLNIGYKMSFVSKETWSLNGIGSGGIGLALFYEKPLFVWSAEYMTEFVWLKKKKINMDIGLGFRYTQNPAYIKYGQINQVLEIPFKVGFKFNLGKKKTENNLGKTI